MKKFRHKNTWASFSAAARGVALGIRSQKNFRTGFLISIFVLITALALKCSFVEMALVITAIGFVLFAELTNTAIEFMVDTYFRNRCSQIAKMTKDIAAGTVLLAIVNAGVIGFLLFFPKVMALVNFD